jgi:hypothetical protein
VIECQLAVATCHITCDLVRTKCRANRIVCPVCFVQHIDTSEQVKIDYTMYVLEFSAYLFAASRSNVGPRVWNAACGITWALRVLCSGYIPDFV